MTQQEAAHLSDQFKTRFSAEVSSTEVSPGRFRFTIISPHFEKMPRMRRQDEVWEMVDQVLNREAALDVSLILTFAPGEVQEFVAEL
jgi:stress-induced morphogen